MTSESREDPAAGRDNAAAKRERSVSTPIFSRATTSGSLDPSSRAVLPMKQPRQFTGRPSFLRATARMPSTNIPSARRAVGSREISGSKCSERLKIEVERLNEQLMLGPERVIEARPAEAHCRQQFGQVGRLVAVLPERLQRSLRRAIRIKTLGSH